MLLKLTHVSKSDPSCIVLKQNPNKHTVFTHAVSMYFIDITKLSCVYEAWHTISMHNWRWFGVCDEVKTNKQTDKENNKQVQIEKKGKKKSWGDVLSNDFF